jgi:peptide/nickel transport system permease protein
VWTYIIRRLLIMIPTLFGVTIVSFAIMQIAPGDPLATQAGAGGAMGTSGETREQYRIRKRDLKLDRPLLFNFRYFYNYKPELLQAAWLRSHASDDVVKRLDEMRAAPADAQLEQQRSFFRHITNRNMTPLQRWGNWLGMTDPATRTDFDSRLADPDKHKQLATALHDYAEIWCSDVGQFGVPAAMELLTAADAPLDQQIGLIKCLRFMDDEPMRFSFSREARAEETEEVVKVWRIWWERNQKKFPPLEEEQRKTLQEGFDALMKAGSRAEQFKLLDDYYWELPDMAFFVEKLLGNSTQDEKVLAATILKLYVPKPLAFDVARNAAQPEVDTVIENWKVAYQAREQYFHPPWWKKVWAVIADTQYGHMVWRLMTFQFGRSTQRTREPVSTLIWDALKVSAPLMFLSSALIYFAAIPLGLLSAVNRGRWTDRLITLGLFLLYSVPAFVAGMLFLLYFAYGDYLKLFPMGRLHSDSAEKLSFFPWVLDYLWHATLPVIALSLFSLAPLAMYARTSLLEILGHDFIRTARAKGLPEWRVILVHGLRNALIPLITLFASFLPALLGGSVLIEQLFSIPGMGKLSFMAILQKDFPLVMAIIYIDAIVVMVSILLTDLLYVFVDPRITFEAQK